jgi:hypothetical protein
MNTSTCALKRNPNSAPVPDALRHELAALVDRFGEPAARRTVGLSRGAFARALAGLGVYPGTVALIRAALVKQQNDQIPDANRGQS